MASVVFICYIAYFVGCLVRHIRIVQDEDLDLYYWQWCDGFGFLIIITCVIFAGLTYFQVKHCVVIL